jgi:ATP-dependent Lon protease
MSSNQRKIEIPDTLPMIPLRDSVIFPEQIMPLSVRREASVRAIEETLKKHRLIFLAAQVDFAEENPTENSIYQYGTVAMLVRHPKTAPDGSLRILLQGVCRARIKKYKRTAPHFEVDIEKRETSLPEEAIPEIEAMIRNAKENLEKIIALGRMISPDVLLILDDMKDASLFADSIMWHGGFKVADAQRVLETEDLKARLSLINEILSAELEVLQMQNKIRTQAKDEMSKSQREYFLREQMRQIKNELGENDSRGEEMEELRQRIMKCEMPESVQVEALKQLGRLERMHPDASEASMVRTYLDWMVDMPWNRSTVDNLDLTRAQKILDEDHYDLAKAKDRILEFLAVRKLKEKNMKGPILCFVGPPGVGKTSLGKSIARAMGREYFRIALGGVKDEAEIRGHRRTYVGAMPGKVVQALKAVKTKNPVIVLDEIDKLGSDFRGDPSAAMLEVLDPEQNHAFRDNYLNVDFDLSNALFIATANVYENIPAALRDRMETLHISGYTESDKLLIARTHLVDRQIEANGITHDQIEITDAGLAYLISHYTREAGLRNLEREVGSLCRKVAKQFVFGHKDKIVVGPHNIPELLGPPKYLREDRLKENQVGIVTGLAWTQAGGEVLFVEALKMRGKGGLVLTGQLGDVMKESARAAWSYARAHAEELGIDPDVFEETEVHIHLPAGAIPKDGPSAGVTMATALTSLLTGVPVRTDIAMTGEVTLLGRVLPVGGIREKALAAMGHGISNILLPVANRKDLQDIPEDFKKKLNFVFVETLDDVLAIAFDRKAMAKNRVTKEKVVGKQKPAASAA